MLPTEWGYVLQLLVSNITAPLAQVGRGPAEIDGVPMHDGAEACIDWRRRQSLWNAPLQIAQQNRNSRSDEKKCDRKIEDTCISWPGKHITEQAAGGRPDSNARDGHKSQQSRSD